MKEKKAIGREMLLAKFNTLLSRIFFSFDKGEVHEKEKVKGMKAFAIQEEMGEKKEKYFNSLLMIIRDDHTWIIEGLHVGLYEKGNETLLPTRFGLVSMRDQVFFLDLEKWQKRGEKKAKEYTLGYCPPSELLARALNYSKMKQKKHVRIGVQLGAIIAIKMMEVELARMMGAVAMAAHIGAVAPKIIVLPLKRLDEEKEVKASLTQIDDDEGEIEELYLEFHSGNVEHMNALGEFSLCNGDEGKPINEGYFSLLPTLKLDEREYFYSKFPLDLSLLPQCKEGASLKLTITPWREQNTENFRRKKKDDIKYILDTYRNTDIIHPTVINAIESLLPAPEGMDII